MLLFKRKKTMMDRVSEQAYRARRGLQLRARQAGHLARAQGELLAAGANQAALKTGGYARKHPVAIAGIAAGIAGLIGWGLTRRGRIDEGVEI